MKLQAQDIQGYLVTCWNRQVRHAYETLPIPPLTFHVHSAPMERVFDSPSPQISKDLEPFEGLEKA